MMIRSTFSLVSICLGPRAASTEILALGSDVEIAARVAEDLHRAHGEIVHAKGAFWHFGELPTGWQSRTISCGLSFMASTAPPFGRVAASRRG